MMIAIDQSKPTAHGNFQIVHSSSPFFVELFDDLIDSVSEFSTSSEGSLFSSANPRFGLEQSGLRQRLNGSYLFVSVSSYVMRIVS